ncbi:MAG: hypothetical protein K6U03_11620, partial [Firmicutes bacterium]|nr:hypothetical protein [Bacillota bacterium]
MRAKTLALIFLPLLFFAGYLGAGAADPPLAAWVYSALSALEEAGLLPEYPAEWIAAGHPLSRHECALYVRTALLRLGEREDTGHGGLSTPVELALTKLVEEFAPELRVLGVEVEPWSGDGRNRSVYIDLDNLLEVIAERPEAPPVNGPPSPQTAGPSEIGIPDRELILAKDENDSNTYRLLRPESFSIPLHDFRKYPNSLIGLAGEVLGLEWAIDLASVSSQAGLGIPLRLGGFAISDESEREKVRGGFGL